MRYNESKLTLTFLAMLVLLFGCSKLLPTATKPTVPEDHSENIDGVLHKPGYEVPFLFESGCADSFCHGTALEGAVAIVEEDPLVAPSCFQCHSKNWSDEVEQDAPVMQMQFQSPND